MLARIARLFEREPPRSYEYKRAKDLIRYAMYGFSEKYPANYMVNLSGLDLTELPPIPNGIKRLTCDRSRRLSRLPPLPESLEQLTVSDCAFTQLPELPKNLTELDCTGNFLTSLPNLPESLEFLDCRMNQLTELPNLPERLKQVHAGKNPLQPPYDIALHTTNPTRIREAIRNYVRPADLEERNIPEGSTNFISYDDIQNGEPMVNFKNSYAHQRYYTKKNWDTWVKTRRNMRRNPTDPSTGLNVSPENIRLYKAKIVPAAAAAATGGKRKTRKQRKARKTQRRRSH